MNTEELKRIVNELPDGFEVKIFADGKDFPIKKIGQTATHYDGESKRLFRPNIILIEG